MTAKRKRSAAALQSPFGFKETPAEASKRRKSAKRMPRALSRKWSPTKEIVKLFGALGKAKRPKMKRRR